LYKRTFFVFLENAVKKGEAGYCNMLQKYQEILNKLVYESKCGGREGVAGSQPMSTAVDTGSQINFGHFILYLTYGTAS
jgi:hypothetical protein